MSKTQLSDDKGITYGSQETHFTENIYNVGKWGRKRWHTFNFSNILRLQRPPFQVGHVCQPYKTTVKIPFDHKNWRQR
jgi:hypothetical protein